MNNKDTDIARLAGMPAQIDLLARKGVIRHFRRGVVLIQEGDVGDSLFIVVSGRIRAYVDDPQGRQFTLGVYGPGEYVGEMSLDGGTRSASVMTTQPTVCSVVSRETLTAHISERPEFAFDLLSRVIRRARMATESARTLALFDVYGRVVRMLEGDLPGVDVAGGRSIERLTQQEMAERVGCSREMISRIMKDLVDGGYLQLERQSIRLVRPLPAGW